MEASVIDLRYNMKEVIKALDRNEEVKVLYHGKIKGVIMPTNLKIVKGVKKHPFFGMLKDENRKVGEIMNVLRRKRYNDI
ncbi:MAG: type II toxin-antitoxin system Phd/YefM family antitoxin [Candidatus Anammoxibacter sp.]